MRRLRNGRRVGRERLQDVDAVPEHPVAHAAAHATPDDRRDVRSRRRLDGRLLGLDAADAQHPTGSSPRRELSDTPREPDAVPAASAAPAAWVIEGVRNFDHTVGSLMPVGFEAYARVFHPSERREGNALVDVPWADVARDYGRVMHPLAEWGSLTGTWSSTDPDRHRIWDEAPSTGKPRARLVRNLATALAPHTQTADDCSFAVWEGWGGIEERLSGAAHFPLPQRPMLLLRGPLTAADAVERWVEPPNIWWPADRAWCVASGIDLMTTYVGGSASCIKALLADERPRRRCRPRSISSPPGMPTPSTRCRHRQGAARSDGMPAVRAPVRAAQRCPTPRLGRRRPSGTRTQEAWRASHASDRGRSSAPAYGVLTPGDGGQDRQLRAIDHGRRQPVQEADVFAGEIHVDEAPQ